MKKFTSYFILLFSLCFFFSAQANASLTNEVLSRITTHAHELKTGGWKPLAGGLISDGLKCIEEMKANEKNKVFIGLTHNSSSLDSAIQTASLFALMKIMQSTRTGVSLIEESTDNKSIKGIFEGHLSFLPIPYFILYKNTNEGNYECIVYYVINIDNMNKQLDENCNLDIYIEGSYHYEDLSEQE